MTPPPARGTAARLRAGDRVLIVGRDHPWFESVGTIRRPWVLPGNGWEIELDTPYGHECAAHNDELRRLDVLLVSERE